MLRSVAQCHAVWRNVAQFGAMSRSVAQCRAVWRNVAQFGAMSRSLAQCRAVWRNVARPSATSVGRQSNFCRHLPRDKNSLFTQNRAFTQIVGDSVVKPAKEM
jgi:cell wall assembly regulator SMI1